MKKFAAVLTALAFIFALVPAGAESAGSASGDWYADAADLRALPAGLGLRERLPEDWDGVVRVETEEGLP